MREASEPLLKGAVRLRTAMGDGFDTFILKVRGLAQRGRNLHLFNWEGNKGGGMSRSDDPGAGCGWHAAAKHTTRLPPCPSPPYPSPTAMPW